MTIQLLTNSCTHTRVGLLAGQQPIQCKYNTTACDKLAQSAASAWWHAGALRLKLGKRAGVPAYLNKWRTPEHQHRAGETTKPRDQDHTTGGGGETKPKQDSKTTDATPQAGGGGDTMGGRGGVASGPASYIYIYVYTHTNGSGFRVPDGR